jgi:hypothetical protein
MNVAVGMTNYLFPGFSLFLVSRHQNSLLGVEIHLPVLLLDACVSVLVRLLLVAKVTTSLVEDSIDSCIVVRDIFWVGVRLLPVVP